MHQDMIFGREKEREILDNLWNSNEAEFLALYGRRRVGKTHLIREYFSQKKGLYFEITGEKEGTLAQQLENFTQILSKTFFNQIPVRPPRSWKKAFELLTTEIEKLPKTKPIVLFFDELPWLATKKSGMLQALDYYWNRFWSSRRKLLLIVCGSAASWMLDHLINAKGGLHNRLTKTILLKPYNLKETQQFLKSRRIHLPVKQILDLYMVFGGIPYYLKQVEKGKSIQQIVNRTCFQKDGLLFDEFNRLFHSLFDRAEVHLSIIKAIAKFPYGISREQLLKEIRLSSGGTLNKRLGELESAGFIQSFIPYGRKIKDHYYRIIDEYCYFYLRFIEPFKSKGMGDGTVYWNAKAKSGTVTAWSGYAFENICIKHAHQIREALDLLSTSCEISNCRIAVKQGEKTRGAQIDLLFDREDGVITLCEVKYSEKPFVLDKAYAKELMSKIEVFEKHFPSNKQIHLALITTSGIKPSIWSSELIQNTVCLADLVKS